MKIERTLCSHDPSKCMMTIKGLFGNIKGIVYYKQQIQELDDNPGYLYKINGRVMGACTDFFHSCDSLLSELKIIKTKFVR